MTADLRENCHFGAFHIFTYFSPKWANIYYSSVLWSTGGCFHHFKRLFGELKKLKIFPTPALREKCHFGHFTNLHISHPNGQIFTFQVSWGQLVVVFISFKGKSLKLSRKSKKLKFFMTTDLRENCHFGAFHIFTYFSPKWANTPGHLSKYLLFKCPVVNWWLFSSF